MLRILVVSNMYPPHHLGGYELTCRDTVERWRALGHRVDVLTTDTRLEGVADPADERRNGVRRDLTFYWKEHELLQPPWVGRLRIERRNQRALRKAIDETRPDVVSIWHMGAMSLGMLTSIAGWGLPMVFVVHDDWLVYGPRVDPWTRPFREKRRVAALVRRLTGVPTRVVLRDDLLAVCFVSEFIRRRAVEHASWPLDRSAVVYGGIDGKDFGLRAATRRSPADPLRLLCVGRVEERKGVHVAVEALSLLCPEATLDVIGRADDRYLARLRSTAERLGVADRLRFSQSPRSELRERYADADVFLFPVLWDEPFGLVPLEAMACGTPVVATGTGGSAEFLIDEVNCILVPPGDAPACATAVRRIRDDASLRDRLVRNGLATARHLDVDAFATELNAWHVAAADRFRSGLPRPPPPLASTLAALADPPER
jgi:glycosyltransferase involved in cell wall biosynthesis